MKPSSKTDAQKRADQIRVFQCELDLLEREQVVALTNEQRRAIEEHHKGFLRQMAQAFAIDQSQREKQLSLAMRIASFLGALALSASVFFLFNQFWGQLSTTLQVIILISAPLLTFIATIMISWKDPSGYFTKLAGLVSFACFVLNISMLGRLFNIAPSDKAFIIWAAFALLLAYACEVRVLLGAGLLCLIGFMSARTGTWSGVYWLYAGERPENFFPAAIVLLVVPLFIDHSRFSGFASIYRVFGFLTLMLPVLILAHWGAGSYLVADPAGIEQFYQVAGFVLSAAVIGWGIHQGWAEAVNTGNVFFAIFLYTKFYDWWWDVLPKYLFFLIVGLTALLLLVIFKRLREVDLIRMGSDSR
jgi:uncharacterized membrane protein